MTSQDEEMTGKEMIGLCNDSHHQQIKGEKERTAIHYFSHLKKEKEEEGTVVELSVRVEQNMELFYMTNSQPAYHKILWCLKMGF